MEMMGIFSNLDLKLNCMAIGSLPHKDLSEAMNVVEKDFSTIPYWPQLAKLNKNEDMTVQFLEMMPGIVNDGEKIYLDNEDDSFFIQLEEFFMDYEDIILNKNYELLSKYSISKDNSSTLNPFLEIVKKSKPKFAKGQIVGPFTLATTLTDKEGKCAYYDETLREVIIKTLILKALWQINEIKKVSSETVPIIFIDEPSISQLGTSAFITIPREEVIGILKEVSDVIKEHGALSAIHCCGKCDWTVPIESGVCVLNLDGYFFAQNLSLFASALKPFLAKGGIIAWGVVPTLDPDALKSANIDILEEKYYDAIEYLVQKGIDKSLLINSSMITPSCGAGSLPVDLAEKAMDLTRELSLRLMEKFN